MGDSDSGHKPHHGDCCVSGDKWDMAESIKGENMKKLMIVAVLALVFAGVAQAEERKFFATALDADWVSIYRAGPAYYHDVDDDGLAFFVEVNAGRLWRFDIGFGGIIPVEAPERARPEFSFGTHVNEWVDVPNWLDLSLGTAAVMSAYRKSQSHIVWAIQLGLVNYRF